MTEPFVVQWGRVGVFGGDFNPTPPDPWEPPPSHRQILTLALVLAVLIAWTVLAVLT